MGLRARLAVPFVFADLLEINRDLCYGLYATAVAGLFALWVRSTGYDFVSAIKRRWRWAVGLRVAFAGVLAAMVVYAPKIRAPAPTGSS